MSTDADLQGLTAIAPNATRHTEAGGIYFHLPHISFPSCGQVLTTEALLCVTPHSGYPTRLLLAVRTPNGGNWTTHQVLARNWHALSVSGITADRAPVEILAEHLDILR